MDNPYLALAAALSASAAAPALAGRKQKRSGFDPHINRHTGQPHEHRREIARNLKRTVPAA